MPPLPAAPPPGPISTMSLLLASNGMCIDNSRKRQGYHKAPPPHTHTSLGGVAGTRREHRCCAAGGGGAARVGSPPRPCAPCLSPRDARWTQQRPQWRHTRGWRQRRCFCKISPHALMREARRNLLRLDCDGLATRCRNGHRRCCSCGARCRAACCVFHPHGAAGERGDGSRAPVQHLVARRARQAHGCGPRAPSRGSV